MVAHCMLVQTEWQQYKIDAGVSQHSPTTNTVTYTLLTSELLLTKYVMSGLLYESTTHYANDSEKHIFHVITYFLKAVF